MALKPCPFCGAKEPTVNIEFADEAGFEDMDPDYMHVICDFNLTGCGASSGFRKDKEAAIKAWEERAK